MIEQRNHWKTIQNLVPLTFSRFVRGGKSFVYVYLRHRDGSPCYVGVASTSDRPGSKYHAIKPPQDRRLIRVLRSGLTRSQAWEWEKYFIAHYGRKDISTGILRNQSDGGEGNNGYRHTPETKQRVSNSMKGRRQTQEWIEKRTSQIKGKNNGMFGKRHTEEARKKMSETRTGMKRGPMSPEARAKISQARLGRPNPAAAHPLSEEHRKALSRGGLERHRKAREARAALRGVTVEELLRLEKQERNQRSYANWKAKKAQEAA